jgi:drug/metabolite transporter (DMT)-like permease
MPHTRSADVFGLSLVGAVFQAGSTPSSEGWDGTSIRSTIMLWTQAVSLAAFAAWARLAGDSFAAPWRYMGWVLTAVGLAGAMNYLIARASARGDISIVGPILALSPIASIVPDWWLTGALPHGIGWVGVGASVLGTVSLSRGEARASTCGPVRARMCCARWVRRPRSARSRRSTGR